jgi:hypothetical protein
MGGVRGPLQWAALRAMEPAPPALNICSAFGTPLAGVECSNLASSCDCAGSLPLLLILSVTMVAPKG